MNKKKLLISLNVNIAIVCLTIIAMGLAVIDVNTMGQPYILMFKYFTTLSNIFLCISSILMIIYEGMWLSHRKYDLPKWVYILKLCATVSTTITFLVVVLFLTPMVASGMNKGITVAFLYSGSNTIFHIISPILAIIVFLLFETRRDIRLPETLFALIFVSLYEVFYTLDVYFKFMPGDDPTAHDWYNFTAFGDQFIPLVLILFLAVTFILSWLLWLGNRKINVLEKTATK